MLERSIEANNLTRFADSPLGKSAEKAEFMPTFPYDDSPIIRPPWIKTWPRFPHRIWDILNPNIRDGDIIRIERIELQAATPADLYFGSEVDGKAGLGLKEISMRRVNPDNAEANIRSHVGFAGEVISTAKENMEAKAKGTGVTTYRADDCPDLFPKNDQYVDKIRVNDATGEIIDRIQCKFIGKDGQDCLHKLAGKKCDKYFNDGVVNKVEIPSEYYDEIRSQKLIEKEIAGLKQQLERVRADGKQDVAQNLESRIERYEKIDQMLERSNTSLKEARFGYEHPEQYMAKLIEAKVFPVSHEVGKQVALNAAGITAVISTVDNATKALAGEITVKEAFADIAKDTGKAGALGYGTGFLSSVATEIMTASGNELIKTAANVGVPGAVISVGVSSWGSIVDYRNGNISGKKLAYDLGKNTTGVAGSMLGSAAAGAAVGSFVPVAGTVVGFGVGLVGGMVGYAATAAAYKSVVEHGGRGAHLLKKKAEMIAEDTLKSVSGNAPDKVDEIKSAFSKFNEANDIPLKV